ncbi:MULTISPECIES: glycosyltransferase family 2 protein [Nostoc]|uniref:Glycosyltransferase family 2 protein n=1 Tax=Nostoc punctiforme FACHB-252 TaxID=1357509 RepID=A0ABR8HDC6_NOSPU|nr:MULTISPECIES: glycosyltransferase family 2 protein [Nostoc]MBC1239481.1 glycosyltransferase family 2 protein [Nostoc sp. 2RC]MBD2613108.1 glycosyltransferase family 2 protein [Nostoc punctiforme FACHB-252]MBL1201074.1 glycosyltransferase family 2 protein [Nostoc sp. GBBB01]MDZ8011624.1 glycosyltransferase family 2 protein [Nostoc sp. ZfuVER08]
MTNESNQPIVSVVIPTRNRPQIVVRGAKSALSQTLQSIEVIVIVDGPDRQTVDALSQIGDPRLRVIELPQNIGPSGARNTGVREAKGTWIAFLDDDDQWLPQKLERQLELATSSTYEFPVVASRFISRTPKGDFICPRRLPQASEPLSEYLFVRNSFFKGEGCIQTSTLFVKKELMEKMPLEEKFPRHEDWEWLLRVNAMENVQILFVPEAMAIWHSEMGIKRLSNVHDWKYSLDWIRSTRHLVTPKAYSGFIATIVSHFASSAGDWKAFLPLLWESIRLGKPRPMDICLYLTMWLIPQDLRQRIRSLFKKNSQTKPTVLKEISP